MQFSEPTTMLTDYLISICGIVFFFSLFRSAQGHRSRSLWSFGFLAVAVSAATGGTFHGWTLYLSPTALRALWNVTVFLIGMSGAFMVAATYVAAPARHEPSVRLLISGVFVTALGFCIQQTGFRINPHFNANDLYHLIQLGGLLLFYQGARTLTDSSRRTSRQV